MDRVQIAGVIIEDNGKILMLKRNFEPGKGKLDLIGGFVDEGETIEQSAVREAKEETGLVVKLLNKLGSFDYFDREEKTIYIFISEIIGGRLKNSIEGIPVWVKIDRLTHNDFAFSYIDKVIQRLKQSIKT